MFARALTIALCAVLSGTAYAEAAGVAAGRSVRSAPDWAAAAREADAEGLHFVEFRLSDGRKVKGRVATVGEDTCVVEHRAGTVTVAYGDVESARWKKHALSRPVKYAIVIGIGFVALLLAAIELGKS